MVRRLLSRPTLTEEYGYALAQEMAQLEKACAPILADCGGMARSESTVWELDMEGEIHIYHVPSLKFVTMSAIKIVS
jgi:hypothetical protein